MKKINKEELKAWFEKNKNLIIWEGGVLFGCVGMTVLPKIWNKIVYGKDHETGKVYIYDKEGDHEHFWLGFVPVNRFGHEVQYDRMDFNCKAESYKEWMAEIEKHAKAALGEKESEE